MPKKKTNKTNKLCLKCENNCKQSDALTLIECPNFVYKSQQIEIKFSFAKNNKQNAHNRR